MTFKKLLSALQRRYRAKPRLRYSIALKLSFGFLIVGVLGVVLAAFFFRLSTQRAFDRFLNERGHPEFVDRLSEYYRSHAGWEGLPETLADSDFDPDARRPPFTVLDVDRIVVYSRTGFQIGEPVPSTDQSDEIPIRVGGGTVGWLLYPKNPQRPEPGTPEGNFILGITRAILYSALAAVSIAILFGVFLARSLTRPIRELTAATQAMADGQLDQQVEVRTQDELGELAASFNRMSTDLARANNLRRQMTADVAHELRTPLSVILGYTEAISEGKLPGSPEAFGAMHTEALHLQRLIEDLRTLSLVDAGELPIMPQAITAQALLKRVAAAYVPQAQRCDITIQVQEPLEELPEIVVDTDRMVQVLGNLVCNALRYTPRGGRIRLAAEPSNNGIRLLVQDNGDGIAPEDLPYIFDRFYRGDKARQSHAGESGLGLAIARSIVEAHGGSITAESSVGKGATFIIEVIETFAKRE